MLKFGGEKALTKHVHDDLKCNLSVDDAKVEVAPVKPALIESSMVIAAPGIVAQPKKVRMDKSKIDR